MKWIVLWMVTAVVAPAALAVPVDFSGYDRACGIRVEPREGKLSANWTSEKSAYDVEFDLSGTGPLLARLAVGSDRQSPRVLAEHVQPQYVLTVGSRQMLPIERYVFFDSPAKRP